jgi:TetR/AcrR family transcriptional regulator, mexJK operon transcriptional repressor
MDASETHRLGRDDRRTAILEIARAAFLQDGYAATSMSQIAVRVGGSKATLYNYFPSKKDLFVAMADRESNKILDELFDVRDFGGEFGAALKVLCRRFLNVLLSDDMIASYRLIVAESVRFPEIGRATYELGVKRGLERLAAYFEQAVDRGVLRPANARIAAELFLDLGAGYLHKQRMWNVAERFSADVIDAEVERIVSTFLATYGNDELSRAARQYTGF